MMALRRKRTGCITCRARHIRCDEQKPYCSNCARTNRKCDGYNAKLSQRRIHEQIQLASNARPINADARLILQEGDFNERAAVHLFNTQACSALSGVFQSILWDELIPQLSHTEPAIRHAAAAVGAAYRKYLGDGIAADSNCGYEFILQQYNKSIRHLVTDQSSASSARILEQEDRILVVCSLFICLELMRDEREEALRHIGSGIDILQQRQKNQLLRLNPHMDGSGPGAMPTQHLTSNIERQVSVILVRLNLELPMPRMKFLSAGSDERKEKDDSLWSQIPVPVPVPIKFESILHARNTLYDLMNQTAGLFAQTGLWDSDIYETTNGTEVEQLLEIYSTRSDTDPKWQYMVSGQKNLIEKCNIWSEAFENLTSRRREGRKGVEKNRKSKVAKVEVLTLRLEYMAFRSFLRDFVKYQETDHDLWSDYYQEMIDVAMELLREEEIRYNQDQQKQQEGSKARTTGMEPETNTSCLDSTSHSHGCGSIFRLDNCIVRSMYWVSRRCRHPLIRRQAVRLLASHQRKEGLFDSAHAARICKRVIEIEEEYVKHLPTSERIPEDKHRLYGVLWEDHSWKLSRPGQIRIIVARKPDGPQGRVEMWEEILEE